MKRVLKKPEISLETLADRSWDIGEGNQSLSRPAFFLPNQMDRYTGVAYTDDPHKEMAGGVSKWEHPARGFLVKDVFFFDGALYKGNGAFWLSQRQSDKPKFKATAELDRGTFYNTVEGDKFFGLWLTDDCTTYPLAAAEGTPVTNDKVLGWHQPVYEEWLGMDPVRSGALYLKEAVFFLDYGRPNHRRDRFRALGQKLLSRVTVTPHPGVVILRRDTGKKRILHNEEELAEQLRIRRGFKVVDITKDSLETIIAACAGARVILGVEGSHMMHGLVVLEPGASVLALQPPSRFCGVLKWTTDMNEQNFAFVVGTPEGEGYRVSLEEVERTLDLLP